MSMVRLLLGAIGLESFWCSIMQSFRKLSTLVPSILVPFARYGFRESGSIGHLGFWGPTQVWPIWPFVWKAWKHAHFVCSTPSKSTFCGSDFAL